MANSVIQIGAREFREELARYLDSDKTVAITRHGRTIGYYIPTSAYHDKAELAALSKGIKSLQEMLEAKGVSEEEIMREFKHRRRSK